LTAKLHDSTGGGRGGQCIIQSEKHTYVRTYVYIGGTHNNLKLDKDKEIEFCEEYKYLGVILYTSGTDDKEIS
jgi:hypothetical protein